MGDHEEGEEEFLGGGRSGNVYRVTENGRSIARKVFVGDRLSKIVHYLCSGAPNPYMWSEDAIACAHLRRMILAELVPFWFGERLRVASSYAFAWNAEARVWQLDTELIAGRPPLLLHPLRKDSGEVQALVGEVMLPLQEKLIEAGIIGLVWQAGKGNPVALNNFLVETDGADPRFAFIDLESGVPALFPMNPLALLFFYLPQSFRFCHALFDDVDCARLNAYLDGKRSALGEERHRRLRELADQLHDRQQRWRDLAWHERGIAYQHTRERLSSAEAEWFRARPWRWRGREGRRAVVKSFHLLAVRLPRRVLAKLRALEWRRILKQSWRLIRSVEARTEFANRYVSKRLQVWRERGQLSEEENGEFLKALKEGTASQYMGDFGAHLGLKASVQVVEITLFSALFAAGVVGGQILVILILADGLIYRSTYTLYRCIQAAAQLRPLPVLALGVGVLPLVGTLAFPVQMMWNATGRKDLLARFIIFDTITRIGSGLPIWGGKDTRTEHVCNRIARRLIPG
jgi:hypothetical protein